MKKHLSVLGVLARMSIYKILGVLLLTGLVEITCFYSRLERELSYVDAEVGAGVAQIEHLIDNNVLSWCIGVSFVLVFILLAVSGTERGARCGYTLRRLSVSEKEVFLLGTLYNTLMLVFFCAVQLVLSYAMCVLYVNRVPAEHVGAQTVFLAFYRSDLLHSLLPLSDILLWMRNISLAMALGCAASGYSFYQRRKKFSASAIALCIFTIVFFVTELGDGFNIGLVIAVSLCNFAYMLFCVCSKEVEYDG